MKFIVLLGLLSLNLINSVLTDADNSSNELINDVTKNKTKFMDLNLDCILMVLEHLPGAELFSLGSTNEFLAFAVRTSAKLPNKTVIYSKADTSDNKPECTLSGDRIYITNLSTMLNFLHFYRHFITKFVMWSIFDIPEQYYDMPMLDELIYPQNQYTKKIHVGLFEKNPQIRNITILSGETKHLPILAKMPNLEILEVTYFANRIGRNEIVSYHFEHLKVFKMSGFTQSVPRNITFGQLEELDINEWDGIDYAGIFDLISNYKSSLKRLRLNINLYEKHMIALRDAKLNVTEMHFKTHPNHIEFDVMSNLIKNSKYLKELVLGKTMIGYWLQASNDKWNQVLNQLKDEFENQWNITRGIMCDTFTRIEEQELPENLNDL